MALVEIFVAQLPDRFRGADVSAPELEGLLGSIFAEARRRWPGVELSAERFFTFVAARLPEDCATLDEGLLALKTSELYLVCACLAGDERAHAAFEASYLPATDAAVARMRSASARPDDVRQLLYQKLLVCEGDQQPKLARYSGKGELSSWLRVTAMRVALDLMRSEKKNEPLDDNALLDHLATPYDDQELAYLKQHYRGEFKAAFQQTLLALSSRERNVLRLQLLDGLNIDQVGGIYKVHRATVARWNQKVREKLLSTTRRALLERLQINRGEFESIMRLIQSKFDVSLCRQLDQTRSRIAVDEGQSSQPGAPAGAGGDDSESS